MNAARLHLLLYVFLSAGVLVHTFDPFSYFYNYFRHEGCDPDWIVFNATGENVQLEGFFSLSVEFCFEREKVKRRRPCDVHCLRSKFSGRSERVTRAFFSVKTEMGE